MLGARRGLRPGWFRRWDGPLRWLPCPSAVARSLNSSSRFLLKVLHFRFSTSTKMSHRKVSIRIRRSKQQGRKSTVGMRTGRIGLIEAKKFWKLGEGDVVPGMAEWEPADVEACIESKADSRSTKSPDTVRSPSCPGSVPPDTADELRRSPRTTPRSPSTSRPPWATRPA